MPSLCEDLLSSVDQPLKVAKCRATGKDYLLCDYNRDGDSYRYEVHGVVDWKGQRMFITGWQNMHFLIKDHLIVIVVLTS